MRFFVPSHHASHRPLLDLSDGPPGVPHPEVPARLVEVLAGVAEHHPVETVHDTADALAAVRRLHADDYVAFLLALGESLSEGEAYVPAMFGPDLSHAPLRHRGGMYCREIGTPIGAHSVPAALNAASTALAAARCVLAGEDAVALCRPPGHHAGRRRYGGYCFFNNAYLAATALQASGGAPVAVVDVDYHLGDGCLDFASAACPYFSLHADPCANYPYWDPSALEVPHATLMTFPPEVTGAGYLACLERLLSAVRETAPAAMVVSLGFDTLGGDPIQDAKTALTVAHFAAIGERLGRLPFPAIVLLEGGYELAALQDCSRLFFAGFSGAR